MSKKEITKLELASDETAYVIYCIGFTYAHLSEYQKGVVKRILGKIVEA